MAHDLYYVEEFLYRGRAVDDTRPTDWHLIVGLNGTDPAGRRHPPLPIMSSEQAIAKGWDLTRVIAEINQDVLADLEATRRRAVAAEASAAQAQASAAQAHSALSAAMTALQAEASAHSQTKAELAAAAGTPAGGE